MPLGTEPKPQGGAEAPLQTIWRPGKAHNTVADYFVAQLRAWGVKRVYGVVGDTILPLISCLGERSSIQFIPTRHEEAAVFMAKAEAALTQTPGVCVATSGPGAAHLVNGLADAMTDSTPVLAITGQVPSDKVGTVHKQFVQLQLLLSPVTSYSAELSNPLASEHVLGQALRTAVAKRTTAHVSVPKDLWTMSAVGASIRPPEPYLETPARSYPHIIDGAMGMLHQAERPVIMVGVGARAAMGDVIRLAETLRSPIVYSLGAAGQVPRNHHLVIGGIGEGGSEASIQLLHEADCILRLGTTWWPQGFVPEHSCLIDVNVRPEHVGIHSLSVYGVVGPMAEVVPQLLSRAPNYPRPEWERRTSELRAAWEARLYDEATATTMNGAAETHVHPAAVISALSRHVAPNAVIALDVGEHVLWFNRHFRGTGGQDLLISGYWRTMGFGLPAAIAAKLAHPDRQVVAVVGDGGIGMSLAEILTAVRLRVPITVVVVNNHSLAMEENEMQALGLKPHGVRLNNPDFARFAKECGAEGIRVESSAQLGDALGRAFSANRPCLVDVVTAPVRIPPMVGSTNGAHKALALKL